MENVRLVRYMTAVIISLVFYRTRWISKFLAFVIILKFQNDLQDGNWNDSSILPWNHGSLQHWWFRCTDIVLLAHIWERSSLTNFRGNSGKYSLKNTEISQLSTMAMIISDLFVWESWRDRFNQNWTKRFVLFTVILVKADCSVWWIWKKVIFVTTSLYNIFNYHAQGIDQVDRCLTSTYCEDSYQRNPIAKSSLRFEISRPFGSNVTPPWVLETPGSIMTRQFRAQRPQVLNYMWTRNVLPVLFGNAAAPARDLPGPRLNIRKDVFP